jgi:hypothetical protein
LQVGAVDLSAEHRHLVAQDKYLDVLGPVVAGELSQHLQDLPKQQVHQGRGHAAIVSAMPASGPPRIAGQPV